LALLGKNKNIVVVVKSSFYINFDKTMMEIYYDFSIGGIAIIFE
jgi:hypothetical protein